MSPVDILITVVVVFALLAAVVAVLARRADRPINPGQLPRDEPTTTEPTTAEPTTAQLSTSGGAVPHDIVALARSGQKIEAIRQFRQRSGVGLAEAKSAVEQAVIQSYDPSQQPPAYQQPPTAQSSGIPADIEAAARRLKAEGRPIEAIKIVREASGLGLRESKLYVDNL